MIWTSVGACYEERPYTPQGIRKRSPDVLATPQLGQAWGLGWLLYDDFPARFPEKFGPVDRIKYVCLWPELLDPDKPAMRTHLPEFFRGALEIRQEHVTEPN